MTALLEAAMLAAFSVSWYCSIWKMLTTKRASGKSLGFVLLIVAGYVCGILSKLALYSETGELSALIALYSWNLLVTAFDAFLVWYYHRHAAEGVPYALMVKLERGTARAWRAAAEPAQNAEVAVVPDVRDDPRTVEARQAGAA